VIVNMHGRTIIKKNSKHMLLYVEEDVMTASKVFLSCHVFALWSFSSIYSSCLRNRAELRLKKVDLRSSVAMLQ
jgi:hypothetical protein